MLNIAIKNLNIDFVRFRVPMMLLTVFLGLASIVCFVVFDLNYGIDFKGGFVLEVTAKGKPDIIKMRQDLNALHLGEVSIQQYGGDKDLLIKVEEKSDPKEQIKAIETIKKTLGDHVEYRRIESVGPKVGAELVHNAVFSFLIAMLGMLIYMLIRFEWQYGLCALTALANDCFAIIGFYTIFRFEFNETAIIAILITAGYSINDTIVVFDRVRENIRKFKKMPMSGIINLSLNETLSRTIYTGVTTLLALLALYFFGGPVIATFSLPILVGVVGGALSSISFASMLLYYIQPKRGEDTPKPNVPVAANS